MNVVGRNVRKLRENRGWTQEQLAAKCNLIAWEVSRSSLAKIEARVRRVTDEEVELLAKALEVEIEALFK